jgi:hypothetical protein
MKKIYSNLKPNDFPFGDEINQQLQNIEDNFNEVKGNSIKQIDGLTLLVEGWTLVEGLYEYELANSNITTTTMVDVIPINADVQIAIDAQVLARTESSTGKVIIYSINLPTANIGVTINLTKLM